LEASSERLVAAAVHPTLPLVVTASASGEVRCMLPTRPTLVYTGLTAAVWAVALSPDGRWLATGGDDGCVALRPGNAPADRDPTTLELLREQGFDAAVKRARERSAPETKAPDGV
jgi:WD40 repeat protein